MHKKKGRTHKPFEKACVLEKRSPFALVCLSGFLRVSAFS